MKNKITFLSLVLLIFIGCSSEETSTEENTVNNEQGELIISKGLGKTSEIFVSNWNKLVSSISEDEQTNDFFSMNPDEVKWTSLDKDTLYYEFGNLENPQTVFVINLKIDKENNTVTQKGNTFYINGEETSSYTFKQDY